MKDQEKQATDSQTESWGYGQAPRTLEEFYTRLEGQVDALLSLSGQVWGYCYTQLTDVEQEQNGIYCYDRSAKFDMDRNQGHFQQTPGTSRPITRRTAARPNERTPKIRKRISGCAFYPVRHRPPAASLVRECAREQKASLNFHSRVFPVSESRYKVFLHIPTICP